MCRVRGCPRCCTSWLRSSKKYDLSIANVLHAGDGNLHPLVAFDPRQADIIGRVRAASSEILHKCVELGGTITGEHGVGLEKQDFMVWLFTDADLAAMRKLKATFDPDDRLNPARCFREHSSIAKIRSRCQYKHE